MERPVKHQRNVVPSLYRCSTFGGARRACGIDTIQLSKIIVADTLVVEWNRASLKHIFRELDAGPNHQARKVGGKLVSVRSQISVVVE